MPNIVHCDLKPENILLTSREDDVAVKISDFGLSRSFAEEASRCNTPTVMRSPKGTPGYVAPENILASGYNTSVDWWSLGVMLYRMASKKFPFDANNLAQLALKITAGSFPPLSPKANGVPPRPAPPAQWVLAMAPRMPLLPPRQLPPPQRRSLLVGRL